MECKGAQGGKFSCQAAGIGGRWHMSEEAKRLQELIDKYDNIVFFGEREFPQKAESRIFEARTACITRSTTILQKPY